MNLLVNNDLEYLNKYQYIIGIDEVGRGCLAGPLVVCGVIMKYDNILNDINDSKKISEKKRDLLYPLIIDESISYIIKVVDSPTVDKLNIYQATKKAMEEIACELYQDNTYILSDAMKLDIEHDHLPIIKGDSKSYAIACASIIAKVYRDNLMKSYHETYPEYDFINNKGYGTKKHLEAIDKYGICELHRLTYEPIKSLVNKQLKLF